MDRSFLFVPGDRPERFGKALASGADAVILDLEDAVKPADKGQARAAVLDFLAHNGRAYIRINDVHSEWFADDLQVCRHAGVLGIVLPKSESCDDIQKVVQVHDDVPLLALIETAQAFTQLDAIAQHPQVSRLLFGTVDFRLDMGIEGDTDSLLYFRSQLVLASRVARIAPPIDGVTLAVHDPEQVSQAACYAKRLGFGGKLCIHPAQVDAVNQAYQPSQTLIAWALKVLELAQQHPGSFALDGAMVDAPVIAQAKQILSQVGLSESS